MGLGQDVSPVIVIATSVILGLTSLAVLLRFYVRIAIQKKLTADDYVVLFAQVNFVAYSFFSIQSTKYGMGKHVIDVFMNDFSDLEKAIKAWWIGQQLFLFAALGVKVAVALFFRSLGPPPKLRAVATIMIVITVLKGIAIEALQIAACWPTSYIWERLNPTAHGTCMSTSGLYLALQILNALDIITDIILAALPCIMLWNMRIRPFEKFCTSILLGLSGLPAIAAFIRALYLKQMLVYNADLTYTIFPVTMTSTAEAGIALFLVCVVRLRPLIRKLVPKSWFSRSRESSQHDIVTIGRLGGFPHGVPEVSVDERLDSAFSAKESPDGKPSKSSGGDSHHISYLEKQIC